ncbi:hypothetical protein M569_12335, partial [Genlisea aurea]
MDVIESAPSTSPSQPSLFRAQSHFYLAVDRVQFKMETLVDLLGMAGRRPGLPMVVCCSSRDELDAVVSNLSNLSSYICVSSLYSDLSEGDRARILDSFRQVSQKWNKFRKAEGNGDERSSSHVIVITDACLPLLTTGESPLSARVLINYELPTNKETYARRLASCLSTDGLMISVVVGGEVVALKSLEESSGLVMDEMPMHV